MHKFNLIYNLLFIYRVNKWQNSIFSTLNQKVFLSKIRLGHITLLPPRTFKTTNKHPWVEMFFLFLPAVYYHHPPCGISTKNDHWSWHRINRFSLDLFGLPSSMANGSTNADLMRVYIALKRLVYIYIFNYTWAVQIHHHTWSRVPSNLCKNALTRCIYIFFLIFNFNLVFIFSLDFHTENVSEQSL